MKDQDKEKCECGEPPLLSMRERFERFIDMAFASDMPRAHKAALYVAFFAGAIEYQATVREARCEGDFDRLTRDLQQFVESSLAGVAAQRAGKAWLQ